MPAPNWPACAVTSSGSQPPLAEVFAREKGVTYSRSIEYVREGRNVLVLRTFSKIVGLAGLRIGYGVAQKECIALLQRVRQPFNVNAVAQAGALAALGDAGHIRMTKAMTRRGLVAALALLVYWIAGKF